MDPSKFEPEYLERMKQVISSSSTNTADQKAEQAKASETPLSPVEFFVANATRLNFELFQNAFQQAIEQIQDVFDEHWIPAGDAAVMMQRLDNAKNFMALSQVYFQALASPVMQACSLHLMNQQIVEATAPREPSAEERMIHGEQLVKMQVVSTVGCSMGPGRKGHVIQYDAEDGEYEVYFVGDFEPSWHGRHCFELEK